MLQRLAISAVLATFGGVDALYLRPSAHPQVATHLSCSRAAESCSMVAKTEVFAVYHTFHDHTRAEEWWTEMSDAEFEPNHPSLHDSGFFCHAFLPANLLGPILSIWEVEHGTRETDLETLIDSTIMPGGALYSKAYRVLPSAIASASAWPDMPLPTTDSAGSFFWTVNGATESFLDTVEALDATKYARNNHVSGVTNHCFLPTGISKLDPVFCVWETSRPMSSDEFQALVNRPMSPVAGASTNAVYLFLPGARLPSAAFPQRASFVGSAVFPMMNDMMGMMDQLIPPPLDDNGDSKEALEMKRLKKSIRRFVSNKEALENIKIVNKINQLMPLQLPKHENSETRGEVSLSAHVGTELGEASLVPVGVWSKKAGKNMKDQGYAA